MSSFPRIKKWLRSSVKMTQKLKGEMAIFKKIILFLLENVLVHTFHMAFAVLGDHACAIFFARRPLVYIQSCVRGSSIQHNPILQRKNVNK